MESVLNAKISDGDKEKIFYGNGRFAAVAVAFSGESDGGIAFSLLFYNLQSLSHLR